MGAIPIAALAALGVVVSALLTFLAVKWKLSGRIDTTEANILWSATESLRHDLAEQLKEREAVIAELRKRLGTAETEIQSLQARLREAENEIHMQKRRLHLAEEQLKALNSKDGDHGK